jgi:Cysteine-rich CPCC
MAFERCWRPVPGVHHKRVKTAQTYTCPCCGYRVFSGPPGTEQLCPICGWRDDVMHLRFPFFNGMPNGISLVDAQLNYSVIGAKDDTALKSVRFAGAGDKRDPDWRPIDLDVDDPQEVPVDFDGIAEPEDPTTLYYWLPPH